MNALIQLESTLIGSEKAVAELQARSSASLLVISDSHGESEIVRQIVETFGSDTDALVFCGDGFEDVMSIVSEAFFNEKLRSFLPPVIACARGNGDAPFVTIPVEDETEKKMDIYKEYRVNPKVIFEVAGRIVLVVHGNRQNVDFGVENLCESAYSADADLVFYGHTHIHEREDIDGTLFLNPGSCARPRGGQSPSFAVISFPGENERYDAEFYCIGKTLFGNYEFIPLGLR
jgi:putative phosphoesterase